MPELLLELLSEEIPAGLQDKGAADLLRLVKEGLRDQALEFDEANGFATARRLTVVVTGLPKTQPDVRTERKGPGINTPDQAIQGFLKSVGRTREEVETRETPKGPVLYFSQTTPGRPTAQVLVDVLAPAIGDVSWAKSMHWADNSFRWVRPVHGLLTVFDGKVIDLTLDLGPEKITASDTTTGHRYMAPDPIELTGFEDYREKLRAAHVVLDAAERRKIIRDGAEALAKDAGLRLRADEKLIGEIAGLVEWPVPLMGRIDEAFMDLPTEVLATSMAKHQRYLALENSDGELAPHFIVVANIEASDGGAGIVAGNERVLRARLADAKFFWDQDTRIPDQDANLPDQPFKTALQAHREKIGEIMFHRKLGSLAEKSDRVRALAVEIAGFIEGADEAQVGVAAYFAKADLVTGMVGEFPNLQGIMGRYYALAADEPTEVADAIRDQYSPKGPDDDCPSAPVSVALCLAERIDTLVVFWAIDEKPTGSKDPFALRRAALGVIRLAWENRLRFDIGRFLRSAALNLIANFDHEIRDFSNYLRTLDRDPTKGEFRRWKSRFLSNQLLDFFAGRLAVQFRDQGIRHDIISAIFPVKLESDDPNILRNIDLVSVIDSAFALSKFLESDDGENLLVAYRRAANIVRIEEKKDSAEYREHADDTLFREAEEGALSTALEEARSTVSRDIADEKFGDAMGALAKLRPPVDAFFDAVTVNDDDPALRANRLRFLSQITSTLEQVADFSKIEG